MATQRLLVLDDAAAAAVLAGHKTMFTRLVEPQPAGASIAGRLLWSKSPEDIGAWSFREGHIEAHGKVLATIHCPYGKEGDRLLLINGTVLEITEVRAEGLQDLSEEDAVSEGARYFREIPMGAPKAYPCRWSMESPSSTDQCLLTAKYAFANHFCKTHGEKSDQGVTNFALWDADPWVWRIAFRRVDS